MGGMLDSANLEWFQWGMEQNMEKLRPAIIPFHSIPPKILQLKPDVRDG